jgi:hypothetical protein
MVLGASDELQIEKANRSPGSGSQVEIFTTSGSYTTSTVNALRLPLPLGTSRACKGTVVLSPGSTLSEPMTTVLVVNAEGLACVSASAPRNASAAQRPPRMYVRETYLITGFTSPTMAQVWE